MRSAAAFDRVVVELAAPPASAPMESATDDAFHRGALVDARATRVLEDISRVANSELGFAFVLLARLDAPLLA
eukprot:14702090-Alexandrium_andersonii.AAC.1